MMEIQDERTPSCLQSVDSKPRFFRQSFIGWSLVIAFSLGGLLIGAFTQLLTSHADLTSLVRTAILGALTVGVGASVFLWGFHQFHLKLFFPLIALTVFLLFVIINHHHHARESLWDNYYSAREMLEDKQIFAGQSSADFLSICKPYSTERFGPFTLYEMHPGSADKLSIVAKDDKLVVARDYCTCTGEHYAFVDGVTKPELERAGVAWKDWREFRSGTWGEWPLE